MNKIAVSLLFLLNAIFSVVNASTNFSNYKLVVVVEEANKKLFEKLDPQEQQVYTNEIDAYNSLIKKQIDLFWKMGTVQYLTKVKVDALIDAKTSATFYLKYTKFSFNYADASAYKTSNKLYTRRNQVEENYIKKQLPYRAASFELKRCDLPETDAAIAFVAMPSIKNNEADFVYAVKSLVLQLTYKNNGTTEVQLMKMYIKNAPHLKELTLLVNPENLERNDPAFMKENYKHNFKITSQDEIDQAILKGDTTKAIALAIPNADGSFSFKVVDAASMEILAQSGSIPPSEYYPELNNKIKANNLQEFIHYIE